METCSLNRNENISKDYAKLDVNLNDYVNSVGQTPREAISAMTASIFATQTTTDSNVTARPLSVVTTMISAAKLLT